MNSKFRWIFSLLAVGLLALATSAKADILIPGASAANAGDVNSNDPNATGTIITSTGVQGFALTNFLHQTVDTGSYQVWVQKDSANTFCSGCIDIVAEISLASGDGIGSISFGDFSGFNVDAAYYPGWTMSALPFNPEVDATSVSRSGGAGSTVTFNFASLINPGQNSDELDIMTNATSYTLGSMQLQDNGNTTVLSYAPATSETSSLSLLGLAMGAGLLVSKRMLLA